MPTNGRSDWFVPDPRRRPRDQAAVVSQVGPVTIAQAVELLILRRGYAPTTAKSLRSNLTKGQFRRFCRARGLANIEDLTDDLVAEFLDVLPRSETNPHGLAPLTVRHIRRQLGWLLALAREQGLTLGPLPAPARRDRRLVLDEEPPLTQAEADRLEGAATNTRDRLIVGLLRATGMRPSELCGLRTSDVRLDRTPACVEVRRTSHDAQRVKTPAARRDCPLDTGGRSLSRALRQYLEVERPAIPTASTNLFLSLHRGKDGLHAPLNYEGLAIMLDRLGRRTGIHCNAYRFRHSVCSWLADAGIPPWSLMTLMGWEHSTMIDRYYRRRAQVALEAATTIRLT